MTKKELTGVSALTKSGAKTTTLIGPGHNHSRVKEKDGTINVSQSKVKAWRNCQRSYHYKFVEGLRKKKVKRPFTFGGIAHQMVEAYAEGDDPFETLNAIELEKGAYFRREVEMYGEIIDDLRVIMTEYFRYWGDDGLKYVRKNGRASEHEFRIELEPGLWFTGRIDGVGRAKKMRWIIEHKTFNKMPNEDERWRSVQGATYLRALQMLGWPTIDGILWDYIHSKPPSTPETLKSGALSQKHIKTLPLKLEEFFEDKGLKAGDYPKLMEEAKATRDEYFRRIYNPIKPYVVDAVWGDFVETAREIAEYHGVKKARNVGKHCSWCDFESLCRGEMMDMDVDFLKSREYIVEEGFEDRGDEED